MTTKYTINEVMDLLGDAVRWASLREPGEEDKEPEGGDKEPGKEEEILWFIQKGSKANAKAPTKREIEKMTTARGVNNILKVLDEKGECAFSATAKVARVVMIRAGEL